MAQTTKLECRHCTFQTNTTDDIPQGKSIACPRCRLPMEIIRPAGASGEENAASFTEDIEPILSTRSARMKSAQKKNLVSNRPPPFHQSRSFIAAVSITTIALGVLVLGILYRNVIGQLNRGMKEIRDNRENRVGKNLPAVPGKPKAEPAKPEDTATPERTAVTKEDHGPVVAPAEKKVGDLVVNVSAAFLVKVYRGSRDECLLLKIRIKNQSQTPITFVSWSQPQNRVVLLDESGKRYNRLEPLVPEPAVIDPDQTIVDSVAFEQTPLGLDLDLELPVAGRQYPVQFRIPALLIKRTMDAAFNEAPAPEQILGAPRPATPVADSKPKNPLHDEVNAAYQERIDKLKVRVRGKNGNEAVLLMKRGKTAILNSLSEKFSVPVNELRRLIDEP